MFQDSVVTHSYLIIDSVGAPQIDSMDIEAKGAIPNTRYVLVALGKFIRIVSVIQIKHETPEAMIEGLNNICTSMGKPKQLYSDEESSMRPAKMNIFLHGNEIKPVQTNTHAHIVEGFIRTFTMNLYRRLDSLKQDITEWRKHTDNTVKNI